MEDLFTVDDTLQAVALMAGICTALSAPRPVPTLFSGGVID